MLIGVSCFSLCAQPPVNRFYKVYTFFCLAFNSYCVTKLTHHMNTRTSNKPQLIPYMAHGIGLPPGRVFALLAYSTIDSAKGWLETIYATKDPEAFSRVSAALRAAVTSEPKLRKASYGNSREVGVLEITDRTAAQKAVESGELVAIPFPATRYRSTKDASRALGLAPETLRVFFARSKQLNHGKDSAVVVRGIKLAFTDSEAWKDPKPGVGVKGKSFDDMGGRPSVPEVRKALDQMTRKLP